MNHDFVNFDLANDSKVTTTLSLNGFEFDYLSDLWTLNRDVTVSMDFLDFFVQPLREDILDTLVYYAEYHSPKYVENLTNMLKLYLRESKCDNFSEIGFLSFQK
ncbi:hypothetical protein [Photobacterium leiognathi]|uniref:hypothetical protein n=1 Tax=Photobacterium leiognathi TaxID=553611 RepID=UPI00273A0FAE|nr:hypothetical protein [Photobacterium leiognathi]